MLDQNENNEDKIESDAEESVYEDDDWNLKINF